MALLYHVVYKCSDSVDCFIGTVWPKQCLDVQLANVFLGIVFRYQWANC